MPTDSLNIMKNSDIAKAVQVLREGGLVAFPTETVYGLGADASNELAVRKVFQAKARPADHPLIVHIGSVNELPDWAEVVPPAAKQLMDAFWPGPLTLVFKKRSYVLASVTGGQDTVAVRMPSHPIASELLQAYGKGLVAPSANQFTHLSPTSAAAVREELGSVIDLILDGGACELGLESTILDVSREKPVILRPGMITRTMLENVLGEPILVATNETTTRAPGRHHLHYAPTTKTILLPTEKVAAYARSLTPADLPVVFVVRHETVLPHETSNIHWVTMPPAAKDYAHELYRMLRTLDQQHYQQIIIEDVPLAPEWEAIRDRLTKASYTQC